MAYNEVCETKVHFKEDLSSNLWGYKIEELSIPIEGSTLKKIGQKKHNPFLMKSAKLKIILKKVKFHEEKT